MEHAIDDQPGRQESLKTYEAILKAIMPPLLDHMAAYLGGDVVADLNRFYYRLQHVGVRRAIFWAAAYSADDSLQDTTFPRFRAAGSAPPALPDIRPYGESSFTEEEAQHLGRLLSVHPLIMDAHAVIEIGVRRYLESFLKPESIPFSRAAFDFDPDSVERLCRIAIGPSPFFGELLPYMMQAADTNPAGDSRTVFTQGLRLAFRRSAFRSREPMPGGETLTRVCPFEKFAGPLWNAVFETGADGAIRHAGRRQSAAFPLFVMARIKEQEQAGAVILRPGFQSLGLAPRDIGKLGEVETPPPRDLAKDLAGAGPL